MGFDYVMRRTTLFADRASDLETACAKTRREVYQFYSFSNHDDFLDALSRLYDMEPRPSIQYDERLFEPEIFSDRI